MIYGVRASKIGIIDIPSTKCQYCQQNSIQRVSVYGRYLHAFWIPVFPVGRKAVSECRDCLKTIEKKQFTPELKQLYLQNKATVKRPIWHWIGLGILGILIALVSIVGATAEEDPRSNLLKQDIGLMSTNPTMESDSVSFKLKRIFDVFATEDIDPADFKYKTKIEGDKALVLVQIPKLSKVEKSERGEVLKMIETIVDGQDDLKDKEKYIGVKGRVSMMLIKTPTYEKNSKLALSSKLYDFYGAKLASE